MLRASYSGDANNGPSSTAFALTVSPGSLVVAISGPIAVADGFTYHYSASVKDSNGNSVTGASVSWTVIPGAGSPTGWIGPTLDWTAPASGQGATTITATASASGYQTSSGSLAITYTKGYTIGPASVTPSGVLQPQKGSTYTVTFSITNQDPAGLDHQYTIDLAQVDASLPSGHLLTPNDELGFNIPFPLTCVLPFGQWSVHPTLVINGQAQTLPADAGAVSVFVPSGQTRVVSYTVENDWNWLPPADAETTLCMVLTGVLSADIDAAKLLTEGQSAFLGGLTSASMMVPEIDFGFQATVNGNAEPTFAGCCSVWTPAWKLAAFFLTVAMSIFPMIETTIEALQSTIIVCTTGIGCPFAVAMFVISVVAEALYAYDTEQIYNSIVDPSTNFTQVATPLPIALQNGTLVMSLPAVEALSPDFQAVVAHAVDFASYNQAASESLDRYEGATAAGDIQFEAVQLQAALGYEKLRDNAWQSFNSTYIQELVSVGNANNFNFLALNSTEVQTVQYLVANFGIPSLELGLLNGLGMSDQVSSLTGSILEYNSTMIGSPYVPGDFNSTSVLLGNETATLLSLVPPVAVISGIVRDTQGNSLPGVVVEAVDSLTNHVVTSSITNSTGAYAVTVALGSVDIDAIPSTSQFVPANETGLSITKNIALNITLFRQSSITSQIFSDTTNSPLVGPGVAGESYYDAASVASASSVPISGTVQYDFYSSGSCVGPFTFDIVSLTSNGSIPNSQSTTPLGAGSYSYSVNYSGDSNYERSASLCEQFIIAKGVPTIASTATPSTLTLGQGGTSDLAQLTGGFAPTGTVTYSVYTDPSCVSQIFTDVEPLGMPSNTFIPSSIGTYQWVAVYNGDGNNTSVSSHCGDELFIVQPNPTTSSTSTSVNCIPSSITIGHVPTCTASVDATGITNWNPLSPSTSPVPRGQAGMTFDVADGYTLLFGGEDGSTILGDTWTFSGNSWSELTPAQSPPAREGAAMVYDTADGYVLLFGGEGTSGALGDTWIFSGGQWTQLNPSSSPAPRGYASIAYDAADGYVVLFGGFPSSGSTPYYSDTWQFKGGLWTQLGPSQSPSPRAGQSMSYDQAVGFVVMFGGSTNFASSGAGLGDTWKFVGGSWTQLSPTTSPSARYTYGMAYDQSLDSVILFGGWVPGGACGNPVGDTWQFIAGDWTQLSPPASPSARQILVMDYDQNLGGLLLFAGQENPGSGPGSGCGTPTLVGDTWDFATPTPTGTVSFTTNNSGTFSPTGCSLVQVSIGTASCSTSYAPAPGSAGTHLIQGSYNGDNLHLPSSGTFTLTVTKQTPMVSSVVTPSTITVSQSASDKATVSGGYVPTGTITYVAYSDTACTIQVFTDTETIGTASKIFTPSTTGTYFWMASYSGDSNNNLVSTNCSATSETLTVNKAPSTIATTVNDSSTKAPWSGNEATGASAYDTSTVTGLPGCTSQCQLSQPIALAFDPANNNVYVTNYGSNTVMVISSASNSIIASIPVGLNPVFVEYDPFNQEIYVSNSGSTTVSVISSATNTVVATITVDPNPPSAGEYGPYWMAFNPTNNEMYVTDYNFPSSSNTVAAINSSTNTVAAMITVGQNPIRLAYDSANGDIYVDDYSSGTVSVINSSNSVVATVSVPGNPNTVGFDPANNDMYVSSNNSNDVTAIDSTSNSAVATIAVGGNPYGMTYDPANSEMYVSSTIGNLVYAINSTTNTVDPRTPITADNPSLPGPYTITYDLTNGYIYASDSGDSAVTVIDSVSNTKIATVLVGNGPDMSVFDPSNNELFVTNVHSNSVSIIDHNNGVVATLTSATGSSIIPSGTVQYEFWTNNGCLGNYATTQTVNLNPDGTVPPSQLTSPLGAGNYSYLAIYGGDSNYLSSTGSCEPFTVNKTTPTITSNANPNNLLVGESGADSATVIGVSGFTPTGSASYTLYSDSVCSLQVFTDTEPMGTPSALFAPAATGTYQWVATYSGDSNYNMVSTSCGAEPLQVTDFAVSASPVSITTSVLSTSNATITVGPIDGFTGAVALAVSVSPSTGLTCTLTPSVSTLGNSQNSTLSCNAGAAGSYTVTVSASGGVITHTATVAYNVQDYTITASPTSTTILAGSTGKSTITVSALQNFNKLVDLTETVSPPTGLTCVLTPSSFVASGTSSLSCSGISGNYTLEVTATAGSLSHSVMLSFVVQDFSLTATPPAATDVGQSATSILSIGRLNGFLNIILSNNGPAGLSCGVIAPSNITGSGTASLSCSSSTAANYTLTVTGASGTLLHSATITFQFVDFQIFASPTIVDTTLGFSAGSTIIVVPVNDFTGTVMLHPLSPCILSPSSITASGNATLSCNFTSGGTYTVTITGTSGTLSHSTMVTVNVMDFSLTASPSSITEAQGPPGGTTMVTVTSLGGFSGTVALTTSLPSGFSASLSPSSLVMSGTSTVTIYVSPPATPGIYLVNITGIGGSLTHTVTITVTVTSTVTVPPAFITQSTWEHRFSLSKYADVQIWRFGVQNNSTNTTVYFSVTITGINTDGTSSFVLTTPVMSEGPQKNMVHISLDQPFTTSQLGETFTFSMVIHWGTTPTPDPSQLPFVSALSAGAPTSGSFTVLP